MTKITKTAVEALKPQEGKDQWLWDSEVPGFGVRCPAGGRKTYVLRYRNKSGVQRKQTIGRVCDMTPDAARNTARKIFSEVAQGGDPMGEKQKKAPKNTLGSMFAAYVQNLKDKGRVSAAEVERALLLASNNAADALGRDKPASAVSAADVVAYVSKIYEQGHRGAADKHRSYISSAYAWAIKSANDYTVAHRQDWGLQSNPAADLQRDPQATTPRERALSVGELRQLWQATKPDASLGFGVEIATCIRLLIACGQRVQETLRIEAADIDLDARVWVMPAHKTKGGKYSHVVPLPDAVVEDLRLLMNIKGGGFLFRCGGTAPMDHRSVMQALGRWIEKTGFAETQVRDIRRTWKSRTHDAGIDRFTRDLIQQHARNDTGSKHYDKADYLPQKRQAMGAWGAWIDVNLNAPASE